jgi:hypothetical protein
VKELARRLARRLPEPVQAQLRARAGDSRLRRTLRPVRWGSLRRLEPVSPYWGSERGTPVDRPYIDSFFAANADAIRGRVLEVRDAGYTTRHGRGVTSIDLVDIDPRNDSATIIADLADEGSLPSSSFDCAVIAQTLVYARDPFATVANVWQSIAPGGTLLLTTPALARVDPAAMDDDRWHLTVAGLREVVRRACPEGSATVSGFGNPVTAIAFLEGIAAEELTAAELAATHPSFPIVVAARVDKP